MTSPDYEGLAERLAAIATSDHERGCDGRCYSCTCGWDAANEKLGPEAAAAIRHLVAERYRLEEALRFYADEPAREFPSDGPWGVNSDDFGRVARAALSGRKEP